MESLRICGILLHKCWLVSKRHWIKTLLGQILLPINLVICAWLIFESKTVAPVVIKTDSYYKMLSTKKLIDDAVTGNRRLPIIYAPNNTFVDDLMAEVHKCFRNKTNMKKFRTEDHLLDFHHKNSREFYGIAVIFNESTNKLTKHLHYKLNIGFKEESLYYPSFEPSFFWLESSPFVQTQICIDESFVKIKSNYNYNKIPEIFIQEVPYPAHIHRPKFRHPDFSLCCVLLLTIAFKISPLIETSKAMNEKFVGITVLMSMNGIPISLNLLSWTINGTLLSSFISVVTTILMFTSTNGFRLPFVSSGNPLIVFLIFMLHVAHTIAFDLHLSAYISKALIVMPIISLVDVLAIIFHIFVLEENNFSISLYVGIFFPNILIYQATDRIYSYELTVGDLQWNNLFGSENLMIKPENSVGMIILLSLLGFIFHFSLATYVGLINPGKYGIGHDPLFFLKKKKRCTEASQVFENVENKYFEPTSRENLKPAIQIRNLRKSYSLSLFSKEKVHALRGVSVDFYKGQITSLLGHNGAGKSTLMSILTRMTCACGGSILVDSKDLQENACEILYDVGFCAQEDMYFPSLTVMEQLEFFATLKRKNKYNVATKESIDDLVQNLKLFTVKDALPNDLSGDQKRKLCLAMAFVGDPGTLILDEPTYGLDPHSKRIVRDLLLKVKDQKTILISTHDMEEADILGDRIAILHDGQLKSYGTSFYLKKMIGGQDTLQVTLHVERWCDCRKILKELPHQEAIVNPESSEITLTVPTLKLPQWLRTLEDKKEDLDVTGYSLAHVSLERVFLKLTEENATTRKLGDAITDDEIKLKGTALHLQIARALVCKKMFYTLKNTSTILIQILMVIVTLLTVATVQICRQYEDRPITILNLNTYDRPRTLYKYFNTTLGDRYEIVSRAMGGNPVNINDNKLDNELMRWAKEDLADYVKHTIAAAEFNATVANAFYSRRATYSLPISVNLLWNTIIQDILGADYSISLSSQQFPEFDDGSYQNWIMSLNTMMTVVSVISFSFIMTAFIVHPSRERLHGIKHLQKMTGVSGFTYWSTMFVFDLIVCVLFIVLLIVGFILVDYGIGLNFYHIEEVVITVMLLMLFVINMLPLIYSISFIEARTKNLVKLLTFIPIALAPVATALIYLHVTFSDMADIVVIDGIAAIDIVLKVFMLLPYVSLIHGYHSLYWIRLRTARCEQLPNLYYESNCNDEYNTEYCCDFQCYDGKCLTSVPYFNEGVNNLNKSVTYLCATPILYFGILAALEWRVFSTIIAKFQKQAAADETIDDEQVHQEKSKVLQHIQKIYKRSNRNAEHDSHTSDDRVFLAYELQKSFKKIRAVSDVSFGVDRGECFGLFGINRSGKSTTFRMVTGEDIVDYGVMYLGDKHYKYHEKDFRSQIGYCSQSDVTTKCFNTYDHLRLFARLRGIPEQQVENEVKAWIGILNLNACASQPSGTLSSGNNQRLNIAIALVGNPKLVLLDEPTTRMDPEARRSFWNTITSRQRTGQSFLLASSNMEECVAACNRMAIMTDGKLTCIGLPKELKHRFGAGYDLQVRMNPRKSSYQLDQVKKEMQSLLHCLLINENLSYLMCRIAGPGMTWKKIYQVMNTIKIKYDCIDDFVIVVRLST